MPQVVYYQVERGGIYQLFTGTPTNRIVQIYLSDEIYIYEPRSSFRKYPPFRPGTMVYLISGLGRGKDRDLPGKAPPRSRQNIRTVTPASLERLHWYEVHQDDLLKTTSEKGSRPCHK